MEGLALSELSEKLQRVKVYAYYLLSPWCLVEFLPIFLIILKELDSYLEREMDFEWRSSALWDKLRTGLSM